MLGAWEPGSRAAILGDCWYLHGIRCKVKLDYSGIKDLGCALTITTDGKAKSPSSEIPQ